MSRDSAGDQAQNSASSSPPVRDDLYPPAAPAVARKAAVTPATVGARPGGDAGCGQFRSRLTGHDRARWKRLID